MDDIRQPLFMNTRQWVNFSAVVAALVMIFIVCLAIAQHLGDRQFINRDVLQQNVKALESYTAEAQVISKSAEQPGTSLRAYTEAYSSTLKDSVDSVAEKLGEHAHDASLDNQVTTTIQLADNLSGRLQMQMQAPARLWPDKPTSDQFFAGLTTQLQNLDDSL